MNFLSQSNKKDILHALHSFQENIPNIEEIDITERKPLSSSHNTLKVSAEQLINSLSFFRETSFKETYKQAKQKNYSFLTAPTIMTLRNIVSKEHPLWNTWIDTSSYQLIGRDTLGQFGKKGDEYVLILHAPLPYEDTAVLLQGTLPLQSFQTYLQGKLPDGNSYRVQHYDDALILLNKGEETFEGILIPYKQAQESLEHLLSWNAVKDHPILLSLSRSRERLASYFEQTQYSTKRISYQKSLINDTNLLTNTEHVTGELFFLSQNGINTLRTLDSSAYFAGVPQHFIQ